MHPAVAAVRPPPGPSQAPPPSADAADPGAQQQTMQRADEWLGRPSSTIDRRRAMQHQADNPTALTMHAFFDQPQSNATFVPQQQPQQQPLALFQPMPFAGSAMQPQQQQQQPQQSGFNAAFMQPPSAMHSQPMRPTQQPPPQSQPQYPTHAAAVAWQPAQPAPAFPQHTMMQQQAQHSSLPNGAPRSALAAVAPLQPPSQPRPNGPVQSAQLQQPQPLHQQSQPQIRSQQSLAPQPQHQQQHPAQLMKGAQPAPPSSATVAAMMPHPQQPQPPMQKQQPGLSSQQPAPSATNGHFAPVQPPSAQPSRPSQPQALNPILSPSSQPQPHLQQIQRPTQPIVTAPLSAAASVTNGPLQPPSSHQQHATGSALVSPPRLPQQPAHPSQQQQQQPPQHAPAQFQPQPHSQAAPPAQSQSQLPQARGLGASAAAPAQNGHATAPAMPMQSSVVVAPPAASSSSRSSTAASTILQPAPTPPIPVAPRVVSDVRKHELLAKAHALYDEQQAHTRLMSQQLIDLRQQLVQTQSQLQQASLQSMMPAAPAFSSDPEVAPLTSALSASPDPALLALFENSKALQSKLAEKHHLVERMRGTIGQVERFVQEQVQKEREQQQQKLENGAAANGTEESNVAAQLSHRARMLAAMHAESASALNAAPVADASLTLSSPIVQTLLSHISALQTQNSLTQSLLLLKNQSLSQQHEQHSTLVSHLREQIANLVSKGERREQENLEERGMLVENLKRMIEELALENEALKKEKQAQIGSQTGSSPRSNGSNQHALQSSPRGSAMSSTSAPNGFGSHSNPAPLTAAPVASSFASPLAAAASVPHARSSHPPSSSLNSTPATAAASAPTHFAPMPPFPHSPQRPAANGTTAAIVPPPFASLLSAAPPPFRPTALPTPQTHSDTMLGPSPFKARPSFLPPLPTN